MVHIKYREHQADAQFAGRPVADARTAYEQAFGIPADATSMVNGQQASEDHLLGEGDKLEFISSSKKGNTA
jgi:hypothetical protein